MNCREFEGRWEDLLDARSAALADLEASLEAHASACPRCQAVSARYQLLHQGLSSLRPPPRPSAASIERLYALTVPSSRLAIPIRPPRSPFRRLGPVAAAAAVFAIAWLSGGWWPSPEPAGPPLPGPRPSVIPGRALGLALAEATEATIDLAREASAPASRIGREMLDLRHGPVANRSLLSILSTPGAGAEDEADAGASVDPDPAPSGLFRSVGERIEAGVKPISGSARYAFSFLLGPPDGLDPAPPKRRDSL